MIAADASAVGDEHEHTSVDEVGWRLQPLPAAARRVWHLTNALGAVAIAALVLVFFRSGLAPESWRGWELSVLVALGAFGLLEAMVLIPLRHRFYRYALLESAVVVVRGRFVRRQSVYPLRHILFVDTRQGPLLRPWGLFDVRLGTIAEGHSLGPVPASVALACRRAVEQGEGTGDAGAAADDEGTG